MLSSLRTSFNSFFKQTAIEESIPFLPLNEIVINKERNDQFDTPIETTLAKEITVCLAILNEVKTSILDKNIEKLEKHTFKTDLVWWSSFVSLLSSGGIGIAILTKFFNYFANTREQLVKLWTNKLDLLTSNYQHLSVQFKQEKDEILNPVAYYEETLNIFRPWLCYGHPYDHGESSECFGCNYHDKRAFENSCSYILFYPAYTGNNCGDIWSGGANNFNLNITELCQMSTAVRPFEQEVNDLFSNKYNTTLTNLNESILATQARISSLNAESNPMSSPLYGTSTILSAIAIFSFLVWFSAYLGYRQEKSKLHLLESCVDKSSIINRLINAASRINHFFNRLNINELIALKESLSVEEKTAFEALTDETRPAFREKLIAHFYISLKDVTIESLIAKFQQAAIALEKHQKPKWMALWCMKQVSKDSVDICHDNRKQIFREAGLLK